MLFLNVINKMHIIIVKMMIASEMGLVFALEFVWKQSNPVLERAINAEASWTAAAAEVGKL